VLPKAPRARYSPIMTRRFALFATLACAASAPAWAQTSYFAAIEDLPLAPGLEERGGFEFAGADGRIIDAEAAGAASAGATRRFYEAALPALGWSQSPAGAGALVFLRGRERLTLTLQEIQGGVLLSARLVLRPASMAVD
jgi:hypothetical protein